MASVEQLRKRLEKFNNSTQKNNEIFRKLHEKINESKVAVYKSIEKVKNSISNFKKALKDKFDVLENTDEKIIDQTIENLDQINKIGQQIDDNYRLCEKSNNSTSVSLDDVTLLIGQETPATTQGI